MVVPDIRSVNINVNLSAEKDSNIVNIIHSDNCLANLNTPLETERKLKVHMPFGRHPGHFSSGPRMDGLKMSEEVVAANDSLLANKCIIGEYRIEMFSS